jgi:hypothetical protein
VNGETAKEFIALGSLFFSFVSVVVGGLISYISRMKEKEQEKSELALQDRAKNLESKCTVLEVKNGQLELKQAVLEGDLRVVNATARSMQGTLEGVQQNIVTRKEFESEMGAMKGSIGEMKDSMGELNSTVHEIRNMLINSMNPGAVANNRASRPNFLRQERRMTNGYNTSRFNQPRERGVDYFDESFRSEQEGLGGAEAAEIVNGVQETLVPDGFRLYYHCNCGEPVSVVISWSELAAIAHRVSPNDPRIGPLSRDPWAHVPQQGGYAPVLPCRSGCNAQRARRVVVQPHEAGKRLQQGAANGFISPQSDPMWAQAMAVFPDLRALGR